MGLVNQQICDGCGKILFGKNGVVSTKESYIQFKGQITTHTVVKESGWVDHMYITPNDMSDLSFCMDKGGVEMDCLKAYVDTRIIITKQKIEASKRRQATEELQSRDDDGNEFTVGTKPYKRYGSNYKREY